MAFATLAALLSVVALVGGSACRAATDEEADFFRGRTILGVYAVADDVAAPRVTRLREALRRALADPDLLREAAAAGLVIAPVQAEELERSITELLSDPVLLSEVTALLAGP